MRGPIVFRQRDVVRAGVEREVLRRHHAQVDQGDPQRAEYAGADAQGRKRGRASGNMAGVPKGPPQVGHEGGSTRGGQDGRVQKIERAAQKAADAAKEDPGAEHEYPDGEVEQQAFAQAQIQPRDMMEQGVAGK